MKQLFRSLRSRPVAWGIGLILLGAFLILPSVIRSNYWTSILVYCFSFAALGVAWNIIGGYGAQISWCHASFVAIGAYTGYLMYLGLGISPFISIFVAMAISYCLATLCGYGTFRLRGSYFSIATIAFAEVVRVLLLYFKGFTGGAGGRFITFRGETFWGLTFRKDTPFYYIMLALLIVVLFVSHRINRSKIGYYLGATKGDEDAAQSLGIPTFKIKLYAFQISAMITTVIGMFFAFFLTYIDPTSVGNLTMSIKIGIVAIVGGIGTLWGPVIGAFIVIPIIEFASILLQKTGGSQILYGLILMIMVIFCPGGIVGLWRSLREKIMPKRKKTNA
ncbi:MAG: branched-chain amino acid ABC transporter permease [Clostridiales bacterium]|nr:branched-chain amino acid ABC transporter permease [Clostridiales bacterium]